jgi:hypothetical protein
LAFSFKFIGGNASTQLSKAPSSPSVIVNGTFTVLSTMKWRGTSGGDDDHD